MFSLRLWNGQVRSFADYKLRKRQPPYTEGFGNVTKVLASIYNHSVKTWDVIIIGGGIIGLSLSIALRKRGATVLIVERGEPGREASHAAAGMLADFPLEMPSVLQPLATASARMYPEFVHELQDESGMNVDLRDQGTIFFATPENLREHPSLTTDCPLPSPLDELEPALGQVNLPAVYLKERSVDPRALTAAALKAAKHRGVDISSGTTVTQVLLADGAPPALAPARQNTRAPAIVNCAGAWAGKLPPHQFPTRPVKGQMLCAGGSIARFAAARHSRTRNLSGPAQRRPHSGRERQSKKRDTTSAPTPDTIQRMHQAAIGWFPSLPRPACWKRGPDYGQALPTICPFSAPLGTAGYFVATGHFRDGILLAPITALVMAQIITGGEPEYDVSAFSPARFSS